MNASSSPNPLAVFGPLFTHRTLIFRLVRREIEGRYRGSYLGILWALLVPLLLLAVYTFVFSVIFQARWDATLSDKRYFALILFTGLVLFNIFSECVGRAPGLMLANPSYIKKVVFPLEVLPWVALLSSLVNAALSFLVLSAGYLLVIGIPPWTVLCFPLVLIPLCLFTLGLSLLLSSLGVFIRDLQQFIGIAIMVLLFLSPIFYPLSAIPESVRPFIELNPLGLAIEHGRGLLFFGTLPDPIVWAAYTSGAWLIAWVGHEWFTRTKRAFADVV
jgi:lipopolysaccharide transport system permease protein